MDERISSYIEALKRNLAGIPEEEIREAVNYYEEYLNDALEAGKDLDEVVSQLDPPEKAAGIIKAERSILQAKRSPGLKNFTRVLRNATLGVTGPLSVFGISLFVFISYCMVVLLFAAAFISILGAVVAGIALLYTAFTIPSTYGIEIAGTVGFAIFCAGILLLLAYGLYKSGRLFIVLSSGMIGRMLKKPGKSGIGPEKEQAAGKPKKGLAVRVCLLVTALGLVLSIVSGLPFKYFTIFNSMKPANVTVRTAEFSTDEISAISAVTANSHIMLTRNTSDRIKVTYEQPDWLDYELTNNGGTLSFTEKSNGKLPLYDVAKIHESVTVLTISLPEGYSPDSVKLESTGGVIGIDRFAGKIEAKTYTGAISLAFGGTAGQYDVNAVTGSGFIDVDGDKAGNKTKDGLEYSSGSGTGQLVTVRSSHGNILIRR